MSIEETMRATLEEVRTLRGKLDAVLAARPLMSVDDLISYEAAALIAGVKPGTIGKWSEPKKGVLRRHGTKRAPLVSRAELEAYLRGRSERTPPQATAEDGAALLLAKRRKL